MFPITRLIQESPTTLAREAMWRARKRWRKRRVRALLQNAHHRPLVFHNLPYYVPARVRVQSLKRDIIVAVADLVRNGEYPFLGYGTRYLGFPPRWDIDFVSGKGWPNSPSDLLEVVRHDGSDVKVPWELSRLQFLPVLGKAFVLTADIRYRDAAKDLLSAWIDQNPTLMGVNWTAPMDAALRAVSICFLLNLIDPSDPGDADWLRKVIISLWQHLLFIEAYLEFSHFRRSNHYLSNILGLFCLSVFLDGPNMAARRNRYAQLLEREIFHQVYQDGGDYEASTGYHILVTQMFTTAVLLMRAAGRKLKPTVQERLSSMYKLTATLADAAGRIPHVGDCDDGRVELLSDDLQQMLSTPVDERHSLTVRNLLGIGGALLGANFGGVSEDAGWYGLDTNACQAGHQQFKREICVFPQSGIAVARRGECEVILLAMPNGIEGKGSHTHNDKLSVIVRIGSEELFCDAGTGVYTRDSAMRNRFRSTASHNTVVVDRSEQNSIPSGPVGLFVLGDEAHVSPIEIRQDGETIGLKASHYGYRKLGVTHIRTIQLLPGRAVIEDSLTGSGVHSVQLNFHVPPVWRVDTSVVIGREIRCSIQGPKSVDLLVTAPCELRMQQFPSQISRTYGSTSPAYRVCIEADAAVPVCFRTELKWPE
jgi:Heparinase II/III-like protein/Heparinase II/III N-terminus